MKQLNNLINFIKKNRLIIFIFLVIFLIAFLLRLFPLRISNWWDETVYLQHAEVFFSGRTNYNEFSFRPPLLSILFFLIYFINHSIFSASILVAFINVLAPIIIFLIGRRLYDLRVGIIAGLISAFTPFIIRNSNYLLTDVPVITFMALAFYLAMFKDKKYLLFYSGVFCSLAVLMKFTAVLLFPILLIYLFLNKTSLKNIFIFGVGSTLILIPYFVWMQISYGNFLTPFIQGSVMVTDKNEETFFYFFNIYNVYTWLTLIGLILGVISFLIKLQEKRYYDFKSDLVMILWIFIFLIYITKVPHKELRYILPITVPIILLASKGISISFNFIKTKYRVILWILFIIYLLILVYPRVHYIQEVGFIDKTISDERIVADYILHEMNYSGVIYASTRWPVLAYYTGLETHFIYPADDRFYSQYQDILNQSGILIGLNKENNPQPIWLDKNSKFVHIKDIGEFFIYEYTP